MIKISRNSKLPTKILAIELSLFFEINILKKRINGI